MVYINLLPVAEIKKRIRARQEIICVIVLFFIVAASVCAYGFVQGNEVDRLTQEVKALSNEKTKYDKILKEIAAIDQRKAALERRISIINKLDQGSGLTVQILDEVAKLTPSSRLWLTSFSQSGGSLRISGVALDHHTVAGYMEALKASPYTTHVELGPVSRRPHAGRLLKTFSMSIGVTMPPAPSVEKDEKKS